ncbi:hypothetical protein CNR22_17780 [Sphingobacteriaceae bacterium]|nr:hypothetical protein CNR22_17780 [Sphingobacteriaceae bacterium]
MKTLYSLFIFFLMLNVLSAQSPAYEGGKEPVAYQPSKEVLDKFKSDYPQVTATWKIEKNYYVADFADTATFKGISIVYDKNANVVRRELEVENSSYPQNINTYFVKNYPGEKFRTWKSTDDKGSQTYCIKRPDGPLWFDAQGNYLDPQKKNEQATASAE